MATAAPAFRVFAGNGDFALDHSAGNLEAADPAGKQLSVEAK
jgi:hypothetical protein